MFDGRVIAGVSHFVAVADAGSYARAALRVGLTRSGVAKSVARLEQRLGMRLFDRTSRALKLTDAGRSFLEDVRPVLERLDAIATAWDGDEVRGRLRISCDAAFGTFLLVPALPALIERHPQLKVEVLIRDRVDNLLAEGIDLAVRFGEPAARQPDPVLLTRSRIITCASATYIERSGRPRSPADLHGHQCVLLIDDASGRPHDWGFENADGERSAILPDCSLTVNDAPSLLAAALCDFGIVRALDFMVEEHLSSGRLVEILPEWNFRLWPAFVHIAARSHQSAAIQAFVAFLRSAPPGGIQLAAVNGQGAPCGADASGYSQDRRHAAEDALPEGRRSGDNLASNERPNASF